MNALDILKERGFLAQVTFEDELYKRLETEPITYYTGFDPTANSLHIGHCIPIMAMAHMQKAGHHPIVLSGGGTAMVGDPSGKTELRDMLSEEMIQANINAIKNQYSKILDFSNNRTIMVNNSDWLSKLNYIEFLREIGSLFSVNRMLTAECYKSRMEKGLTFLEFNYMIMQSYDFLQLFKKYNCRLQMGGDDQWSNILAGADLIRRKEHEDAFALTYKLIMTHDGKKMGKTEKGALWLDPNRTSPYDFYQYWINVADQDVEQFLSLLTFLPMDEVKRLSSLKDSALNEAKRVLAFEVTQMIHGTEEAEKAQEASLSLFGGKADSTNIPSFEWDYTLFREDNRMTTLLALCGLCTSRSEARKVVQSGAVALNSVKISEIEYRIDENLFPSDGILLRKGKKSHCRILLNK